MNKLVYSILLVLLCLLSQAQIDTLPEMKQDLAPAEIDASRDSSPGMLQMRTIENFAIYAGRKTELILPSENSGNNSNNLAREQFAKVSGLNIWEDPSGLQLSIGGRGLDPNRSSNFNTRQDAYAISADPLGYPESYYAPMLHSVERIEILRGTSALQYGSQFGGMIKFRMKQGRENEKLHLQSESGYSSFNTWHSFNSMDGSKGGWNYYAAFQLRNGDGWRPNSRFDSNQLFVRLGKQIHPKLKIQFDWSKLEYLSQQPGGLTDTQFLIDPRQSFRERNWFGVNWNIIAIDINWQYKPNFAYTANFSVLNAEREALGFLGKISRTDPGLERDLISGNFNNFSFEQRMIFRHQISSATAALVAGSYHYNGATTSKQGLANDGSGPTFEFIDEINVYGSDFSFSSQNHALFAEEAIFLSEKVVFSAGTRAEYIETGSDGYYILTERDGAGNILPGYPKQVSDTNQKERYVALFGMGLEFRPKESKTWYMNITKNYRALNFSDLYINIPGLMVDSTISDEQGYSADLGYKWRKKHWFAELSTFGIVYEDRVGLIQTSVEDEWLGTVPVNLRTNVGNAIITGVEYLLEFKSNKLNNWQLHFFTNGSLTNARYVGNQDYKDNFVEYVPFWTSRTGIKVHYKKYHFNYLITATGKQYTNADNGEFKSDADAVTGAIPAWWVNDCSISYKTPKLELKAGSNNVWNAFYFSRRANGYPGPGILPSDGRSFYFSLKLDLNLL
jgi:Fe(3+) dicitrate transport protein